VHVTSDICQGLQVSMQDAERLKTMHGGLVATGLDDRDMIELPSILGDWEHDRRQISRSELIGVMRPRVEEILEEVRARLDASGFEYLPSQRIVLTGGSAQIPGLETAATRILGRQCRIGKPLRVQGLPQSATGTAFSTAVGAIAMKTTAAPILRRFGFKQVLVINAVVSAIFIGVPALFTPITPHGLILLLLLVGGFFKSLQFTSINTLAYADIEPRAMSAATSFASVAQQLSMSAGVAVGALVLETQRHGRADMAVEASDFTTAFVVVGLISAVSAFIFMRWPKSAGASLAGPARPVGAAREKIAEAEARVDL